MKFLILTAFLFSHNLFAANITEIKSYKSFGLSRTNNFAKKIQERTREDYIFTNWGYTIDFKKPTEKIESTIKQMIYINYTGWSKPDSLSVKEIDKGMALLEIEEMKESFLDEYIEYDEEACKVIKRNFKRMINFLNRNYKNLALYSAQHSNSFGGGSSIVLLNKRTNEILFLEAVWTE